MACKYKVRALGKNFPTPMSPNVSSVLALGAGSELLRAEDHGHIPAFQFGVLLDHGQVFGFFDDP